MRFVVPELDNKTVLVTGANRGIGLEVARGLARGGAHVVVMCRNASRAVRLERELRAEASGGVSVVGCELSDLANVDAVAREIRGGVSKLDAIVHNAGVFSSALVRTAQGFEPMFAVDVLAPFLLNRRLESLLAPGARIVQLAGIYHLDGHVDLDDLHFVRRPYDPAVANAQAQLARVVLAFAWSRRLAARGVTVNAVHPGPVLTDALKEAPWVARAIAHTVARPGFYTPAAGAEPVLRLVADPNLHVTGMFYRRYDLHPSSESAHDLRLARRLWEACEAMLSVADLRDA